ncbi:MAG: hypothetical protein ACLGG7_10190 [Bacteriovoracia bacterium]
MKILGLLLVLVSCAHQVRKEGGQAPFDPATYAQLTAQDLPTYAQTVVLKEERDPEGITHTELRQSPHGQIKRAAILVFETELQASRSGLAKDQNVYLSARGKQILTEELLAHWEKELHRTTRVEWVPRRELLSSKAYRSAGFTETDLILSSKFSLSPEDVLWRMPGKKIPEETLLMPRNYQDISMVFVPGAQLMAGPKPSQHQHHWVNDVARELNLDAVLVVYVSADWRRETIDKNTQVKTPEGLTASVLGSLLYPFSKYHAAVAEKSSYSVAKVNVPFGVYSLKATKPLTITGAPETFDGAQQSVITPVRETVEQMTTLLIERMASDLHQIPMKRHEE